MSCTNYEDGRFLTTTRGSQMEVTREWVAITFGRYVKAERNKQQLTQAELALRSNLRSSAISLWERAKRVPTLRGLLSLSRGLNIDGAEMIRIALIGSARSPAPAVAPLSNLSYQAVTTAFGSVLREARESLGMTQEQLAEYADMDRTYPGKLEHGRPQPTLYTLIHLGRGLGMDAPTLVKKIIEKLELIAATQQ
jgi:transcriptional regulator with XRE-family HTH domain